jgi:hypothetical protein
MPLGRLFCTIIVPIAALFKAHYITPFFVSTTPLLDSSSPYNQFMQANPCPCVYSSVHFCHVYDVHSIVVIPPDDIQPANPAALLRLLIRHSVLRYSRNSR